MSGACKLCRLLADELEPSEPSVTCGDCGAVVESSALAARKAASDLQRLELVAITVRRAERADRYMAALGACAATAGVYASVAEGFWLLGMEDEALVYAKRAKACEEFCTERPTPTVPVAQRRRLPNVPPEAPTIASRRKRAA
jgi:hypothetical protein